MTDTSDTSHPTSTAATVAARPYSISSGVLSVDLGAIMRNWQAMNKVSGAATTGAVIKGDGYGTGMEAAARALFGAGARFFFVATPNEALDLRQILPSAHICVLDGLWPGTAEIFAAERLIPVLGSMEMLHEWLRFCGQKEIAFPAAIHFDTGMNRMGFRIEEAALVRSQIDSVGYKPQFLMSHLACADIPSHEKNRTQLALLQTVLPHFPNCPISLANSAGVMNGKDYHFDLVRPGIALFGGRAVVGRPNPLSPVVHLQAPIIQIRDVKVGESVGYGASFTIKRASKVATIAIGYADGLLRAVGSSNAHAGSHVFINGVRLPILGRVSMDMITVDLSDLGADLPAIGSMVEILGDNISIDDHADAAGTIGYEILTSLKGRYDRRYINVPAAVMNAGAETDMP